MPVTPPQYDIQQQYFRKPCTLSKKEAFNLFLWNPKTSEVFGRTGTSWGKLCKEKGFPVVMQKKNCHFL